MKAEGHTARELCNSNWPLGDVEGLEDRDIASVLRAAIDDREDPAVAFFRTARNKDRLAGSIAARKSIDLPGAAREIHMCERIEDHFIGVAHTRGEPAMLIGKPRAPLVKA